MTVKARTITEPVRRALVIVPYNPFPVIGGGALRSACVIEHLSRRYHTDVVMFAPADRPTPTSDTSSARIIRIPLSQSSDHLPFRLRKWLTAMHSLPPLYRTFSGYQSSIESILPAKQYDVAVIEHTCCASYAPIIRRRCNRLVLDLHNVDSLLLARSAELETGIVRWAQKRWAKHARQWEVGWIGQYDDALVTSAVEGQMVTAMGYQGRISVIQNAIPTREAPARKEDNSIVFAGDMAYPPNIAAVRFFRNSIWPIVRERIPGCVWRLLGRNCETVREYTQGDPRIEVIGAVDDAIENVATAKVAVVPLLSGAGTRLKIIEAWAAGTAVVSTSVGAEGLGYTSGTHLIVADEPAKFAEAIARLFRDSQARIKIAAAGRELYERRFTWEEAWRSLSAIGI